MRKQGRGQIKYEQRKNYQSQGNKPTQKKENKVGNNIDDRSLIFYCLYFQKILPVPGFVFSSSHGKVKQKLKFYTS